MKEVVITGLGAVAPNGVGKDKFWNALKQGQSGIRRISRFDPSEFPSQIAGEIPLEWVQEINPYMNNKRAWSTHLIVTAASLALQDSKIIKEDFASSKAGIFVGISTTDMDVVEREYNYFKQYNTTSPTAILSSFPHAAASELANEFNCSGQVVTVSSSCPSGIFSIINGVELILRGEAELVLAGGGDAPITPLLHAGFCAAGLLSSSPGQNFGTASKPFDARRDGGVLAEGAGMVVLESAERASLRGAKIYARINGWGISNAASLKQLKSSIISSIIQSLQKAYLKPHMIDYICAHAPGDKFIDKMETNAIKEVFGEHAYNMPVSSIKSMIGNPLAASGPLQVIAAAMVIKEKFIPPTINYEFPDPHCDLDYVPNKGRMARVDTALVNLHGLGGCNASLVLTKG